MSLQSGEQIVRHEGQWTEKPIAGEVLARVHAITDAEFVTLLTLMILLSLSGHPTSPLLRFLSMNRSFSSMKERKMMTSIVEVTKMSPPKMANTLKALMATATMTMTAIMVTGFWKMMKMEPGMPTKTTKIVSRTMIAQNQERPKVAIPKTKVAMILSLKTKKQFPSSVIEPPELQDKMPFENRTLKAPYTRKTNRSQQEKKR